MRPNKPKAEPIRTPLLSDVETLRRNARENIDAGAVTASYGLDRTAVIEVLNQALATEMVCMLRYKRHYFMAMGIHSEAVKEEFLEHAIQEQRHADMLCERIVQLGGAPDLNPDGFSKRSHSEYVEGETLREMIKEDLIAERVAIQSYTEIVNWLDGKDSTTHKLMREILAIEEEHAEDMVSLLKGLGGEHDGPEARQNGH